MDLLGDRRQRVHLVGPRRHLHRRAEVRWYGVHLALLPRHLRARPAIRWDVQVTRPADRMSSLSGEQRATARKCLCFAKIPKVFCAVH